MSAHGERREDERLPGEVAGVLASALPASTETRARASALRERVLARVRDDSERSPREVTTVRAEEGDWREILPGMFEKLLYVDRATGMRSFLLRGGPGTGVPPHVHRGAEECLLLEGDIRVGDVSLRPGDYHVAPPGTTHPSLTSDTGFLAFLREPLRSRDG